MHWFSIHDIKVWWIHIEYMDIIDVHVRCASLACYTSTSLIITCYVMIIRCWWMHLGFSWVPSWSCSWFISADDIHFVHIHHHRWHHAMIDMMTRRYIDHIHDSFNDVDEHVHQHHYTVIIRWWSLNSSSMSYSYHHLGITSSLMIHQCIRYYHHDDVYANPRHTHLWWWWSYT